MFDWLYKRLADGILRNIDLEKLINDEENQKLLLGFTDSLFERYKRLVVGSISGSVGGRGNVTEGSNPLQNLPIPKQFKGLLNNPYVQMILGGLGKKQGESGDTHLP